MSKLIALSLLAVPFTLTAANVAQEYEQVKKIALRDPKVRAAYAEADRRLAERIVEIDPALKGYTPGAPAPKAKPAPAKPVTKAAPKPAAPRPVAGSKHKVAAGETLESIAAQYRIGVPTLKQANPGVQERKLQVGQVLVIPKKNTTAASKAKSAPKKEQSWWDKLTTES